MRERIIALREHFGLTQSEFGKRIGLTNSGVSNIEQGLREVSERHILLILSAFPQVSEAWLRDGEGPMFAAKEPTPLDEIIRRYDFDALTARMLRTFHHLSPDQQAAVLEYAHSLILSILDDAEVEQQVDSYREELLQQKRESSRSPTTEGGGHDEKIS